jgi:hypothetical protein
MPSVVDSIGRICRIAKIAEEIDAKLDELHGIDRSVGFVMFEENTMARIHDVNIGVSSLERFLASLDLTTLRRLEALMYSGRDDQPAVQLKEHLKVPHETKEAVVRTISEKRMNLSVYFDRGLDRARRDGIDIESF